MITKKIVYLITKVRNVRVLRSIVKQERDYAESGIIVEQIG